MRLQIATIAAVLMLMCNISFAQIKLATDGKIGIGTASPTTNLDIYMPQVLFRCSTSTKKLRIQYLYGDKPMFEPTVSNEAYLGYNYRWYWLKAKYVYCDDLIEGSDAKIKTNIRDLEYSLDKVLQMRGVMYNQVEAPSENPQVEEENEDLKNDSRDHIGLIADELLTIVPEAVSYDTLTNLYGISYTRLIPILIEAIKEQNEMILDLQKKIENTDEKSAETPTAEGVLKASLGKNRPNPFTENTTIEYYLPSTVEKAILYVYDLQGKQVKSIPVYERDYGLVTIQGSELRPGIYNYSLIADGEIVGIEKMILTD